MNDARQILDQIAAEVRACRRCPLGKLRTRAVPGEGPTNAEIMFIGEGPGFHEDQQGRPFVGASGQFLENLLASIHLRRDQVFIANVIKCRPPNNRDPMPEEITACDPYLTQQLAALHPLIIVTLGRFSMARFLPPTARITSVHGKPISRDDSIVLPMFHPAAALRNPQWQQAMYDDIAKIPALLDQVRKLRAPQQEPKPIPDDFQQLSLF